MAAAPFINTWLPFGSLSRPRHATAVQDSRHYRLPSLHYLLLGPVAIALLLLIVGALTSAWKSARRCDITWLADSPLTQDTNTERSHSVSRVTGSDTTTSNKDSIATQIPPCALLPPASKRVESTSPARTGQGRGANAKDCPFGSSAVVRRLCSFGKLSAVGLLVCASELPGPSKAQDAHNRTAVATPAAVMVCCCTLLHATADTTTRQSMRVQRRKSGVAPSPKAQSYDSLL